MKGTDTNFAKVASIEAEDWNGLSPFKKKSYWDLHKRYPKEHLLDHLVEELGLNDRKVNIETKKCDNERVQQNNKKMNDKRSNNMESRILEAIEKSSVESRIKIKNLEDVLQKEKELRKESDKEVLHHKITIVTLEKKCDKYETDRKDDNQIFNNTIKESKKNIKRLEEKIKEHEIKIDNNKKMTERIQREADEMRLRFEERDKQVVELQKQSDIKDREIAELKEKYNRLMEVHTKDMDKKANEQ